MRRSNLPTRIAILTALFLLVVSSLSGCTSRTFNPVAAETSSASNGGSVVDINTATVRDLENLPSVGPALAAKIVEHRDRHGPFRKPEHILLVDGISEGRYRQFKDLIDAK